MSTEPGLLGIFRPRYRTSEAVTEAYGHWEPPDEAAAREAYLKSHAHHGVFEVTCEAKDLKEFGEGVQMYFFILKHLSFLFCGLALVPGLLLVIFNGLGGWYDEADLERTMLGNYGLLSYHGSGSGVNITTSSTTRSIATEGAVTALFASTATLHPARLSGMNKRELMVAMSILDLLGVVAFFACAMYLLLFVRTRSAALDMSATTVKQYSVRVEGLPPDTTAAALREYLAAAPGGERVEIVDLELCRCVDNLLALVVERGQVVKQGELALAVVQRKAEVSPRVPESLIVDLLFSRYLLEDLTAAIHQEQAATKTNEVVGAFVTFSTPEGRARVLRALPRSAVKQWRMRPEAKFNNGGVGQARIKPVALHLSDAPEPSDIQYENLEFTKLERAMRAIATNIAKYVVLLIGFLLVSLAPAMRMGLSGLSAAPDISECRASCSYMDGAGNYVLSTANRTLYRDCDPVAGTGALPNKLDCEALSKCYECYCRAVLNAGTFGELSYCSRFSSVMAVYTGAQALAVIGVVAANMLIEYVIKWLVKQEKHQTRTREAVGVTRGLFMTTLVNTAFSNLVANMYLPGPAGVIGSTFLSSWVFTGSFADTTPNWYHDVCRPITISLMVNTLLTHCKVAGRWLLRRRGLATRYRCLTQWQMDEAYEGHEFELAIKYGHHLYVLYVVMIYSSGVPLLYIIGAVHFATCYWTEKYELLRLCQRPLTYSRELAAYFTSSLPFAALWHLAFGIWFYSLFGAPRSSLIAKAFRVSLETSIAVFKALMPVASGLTPDLVASRFTARNSAHLFLAFIAVGGTLFIFFTLSTWLAVMRSLAKHLGLLREAGSEDEAAAAAEAAAAGGTALLPDFAAAVRSQLLVGPTSYAVQQNPAYKHAFARMEELEWDTNKEPPPPGSLQYDSLPGVAADPTAAAANGGAAASTSLSSTLSRRKRTTANRLRAKQKAAAAMAVNLSSAEAGGSGGGGGRSGANKVVPEPPPPLPPIARALPSASLPQSLPPLQLQLQPADPVSESVEVPLALSPEPQSQSQREPQQQQYLHDVGSGSSCWAGGGASGGGREAAAQRHLQQNTKAAAAAAAAGTGAARRQQQQHTSDNTAAAAVGKGSRASSPPATAPPQRATAVLPQSSLGQPQGRDVADQALPYGGSGVEHATSASAAAAPAAAVQRRSPASSSGSQHERQFVVPKPQTVTGQRGDMIQPKQPQQQQQQPQQQLRLPMQAQTRTWGSQPPAGRRLPG